jgi:hypothetical protein
MGIPTILNTNTFFGTVLAQINDYSYLYVLNSNINISVTNTFYNMSGIV